MARELTRKRGGSDISPWRELDLWSDDLNRMFPSRLAERMFATPFWSQAESWLPAVELIEEDGEYVLTAELPGISKDDVDVSVDDNVLTIKGEKRLERDEERGRAHIRERRYGAFERSFTLPRNVDPNKVKAEFHDGIVEIHLPKGQEAKARHIEIK